MDERTPIMTVRIDPSHIFSDEAVSDPFELSEIWTDSIAPELAGDDSTPSNRANVDGSLNEPPGAAP